MYSIKVFEEYDIFPDPIETPNPDDFYQSVEYANEVANRFTDKDKLVVVSLYTTTITYPMIMKVWEIVVRSGKKVSAIKSWLVCRNIEFSDEDIRYLKSKHLYLHKSLIEGEHIIESYYTLGGDFLMVLCTRLDVEFIIEGGSVVLIKKGQ